MAAKRLPTYNYFEPVVETSEEDGCTILAIHLPGFSKEQIQIHVSSTGMLMINGERPHRNKAIQRFHKDFQVPPNCKTAYITANYKAGILYVRQPSRPEFRSPHTAPTAATIVKDRENEADGEVEVKSLGILEELIMDCWAQIIRAFVSECVAAINRDITRLLKLLLAILVAALLFIIFIFVKRTKD